MSNVRTARWLSMTGSIAAALLLGLFCVLSVSGAIQLSSSDIIYVVSNDLAPLAREDFGPSMVLVPSLHGTDTPVAVMVENHIDSRPSVGLDAARVVYEAPAEGGITRFLAIFSLAAVPHKIGPVRSVRPYYIDWAEEWGATLFHSGGSPEALKKLKTIDLPNINEISADGRYFWRDDTQVRPHNLYTSGEHMQEAFAHYELPTSVDFLAYPTSAELLVGERPAAHPVVRITFSDSNYCVGYRYEPAVNAYERWLGGIPQATADGAAIYAKTVVVQAITSQVLDREGRLRMNLDDGGVAMVFTNAKVYVAEWRRQDEKTMYVDENENQIPFADGPVWITVVPDISVVVVAPSAVLPPRSESWDVDFSLGCD